MKLKERMKDWLKRVTTRTASEIAKLKREDELRAMRNPHHPQTFVGQTFLGRNDLCYCGSGIKFKDCCWSKHAVLPPGTMTPELGRYMKKQEVYFKKHGRILT